MSLALWFWLKQMKRHFLQLRKIDLPKRKFLFLPTLIDLFIANCYPKIKLLNILVNVVVIGYINYQSEFDLIKHLSKEELVLICPNTLG